VAEHMVEFGAAGVTTEPPRVMLARYLSLPSLQRKIKQQRDTPGPLTKLDSHRQKEPLIQFSMHPIASIRSFS
jgi:hypothetical protein